MCKPRNIHRSLEYHLSKSSPCKFFVLCFWLPSTEGGSVLVGFLVTLFFMRFWEAKKDFCQQLKKIKAVLIQGQVMKAKTR